MKTFRTLLAITGILVSMALLGSCSALSDKNGTKYQTPNDSIENLIARHLMEKQEFVLTADRIVLGRSPIMNVTSNTNFVLVNGKEGVVQLSPAMGGGPNGVGGITASGTITGYRVIPQKNGETTVRFHLASNIGSADVSVTLYKDCAKGVANVDATFYSGRSVLYGNIAPVSNDITRGR